MSTTTGLVFAGAVAFALTLATSAARAADRPLVVVSWGGDYQKAQKQVYFEPFRKATGAPMIDESWDGGIGVLRAKVQGGKADWDVVQVESEELELGCDEGLFVKLDYSKIGGKDAYLPEAVNPCGVGAIVYDFILAYDRDKLKDPPQSWADFFDTKKYPGKRALRMGPKTTLEIALIGDGVAPPTFTRCWARRWASTALSRSWIPSRTTSSSGRPARSRRSCSPRARWP
jgi:putative spermidine/putrescine transport system substrate-binding protein